MDPENDTSFAEDLARVNTKDFVDAFSDKSTIARRSIGLFASGELPEGVDPNNPGVKEIVDWCKEQKK